jgi:hypothetical protein
VGSHGRDPVFAVVPVVYHRDMPADGIIKWVYLQKRRGTGVFWKWELLVVIARPGGWPIPDAAADGTVGIDLGWRVVPGGLRVARWVASDGASGELVIPDADLERWSRPEANRSARDHAMNMTVPVLADWLDENADKVPDWLKARAETLRQWRSQARLAALVRDWSHNRFPGDGAVYGDMAAWLRVDTRDFNSESGERLRAVRWRDDYYRNFVARLRRQYRTAAVEDADWSDLARRADPEDARGDGNETARRNRVIAAPGRLAQLIRDGFAEVRRVESEYTTQRCCVCGKLDAFDAEVELVRTCRHCDDRRDQDDRAAQNLLASGLAAPGAARGPDDDDAE